LDTSTRIRTPLIKSEAWQTNFSPDGHWVVFGQGAGHVSKLFVAPLEGEAEIFEKQWIPLNDGHSWDDKPRWSLDGNLVYFTSDRGDGFVCLWAQRLDPTSKSPKGPPFSIYHRHQTRCSLSNAGYYNLELSVASDKIVFSMAELTGNIWMTKLNLK
jgi:hypothetical protein